MKIFLDTANVEQIRCAHEMGLLDGVTTNPSLIAKEGQEFRSLLVRICEITSGPVSAEVVSTEAAGMLEEARSLAKLAENIVVKLPTTREGKRVRSCILTFGIEL